VHPRAGNRTSAHANGRSRAFNLAILDALRMCGDRRMLSTAAALRARKMRIIPSPLVAAEGVAPSSAPAIAAFHSVAMTCAQIAIMPKNSASDASVAASSTRARTMISYSHRQEQVMNIVHAMFQVKCLNFNLLAA